MAIRKALKWTIHLYDVLTYLWVLADLLLPILTTSKWCFETTWNTPHISLPVAKSCCTYTISSWKANLATAGRNDCQQWLVPSGPCADKLSFILNSSVTFPEGGDETLTKSFVSFLLLQCVEYLADFTHFNTHSLQGEDIWRTWAHLGCSRLLCPCLMLSSLTGAVTVAIAFGEQWLMIVLVPLPNPQMQCFLLFLSVSVP